MDLISKRKIFLSLAFAIVALSVASVLIFGLRPGIDFSGGAQWRVDVADPEVTALAVEQFFRQEFGVAASVKRVEDEFLIRLPSITEEEHQSYKAGLEEAFEGAQEKSFSNVGPVIGRELKQKSIWAVFGVLISISLFVAWAFRHVSKPIKSWKYGLITLGTLFHDVIIPTGVFALLGRIMGVEVDTTFIVALLVVIGFSVNDTIIVFDRVRENLLLVKDKKFDLADVINISVNQTIMRSINTSLTLVLVLIALIIWGPPSLFYFVLTILIGTVVGTYSSIFVASPLLYIWRGKD